MRALRNRGNEVSLSIFFPTKEAIPQATFGVSCEIACLSVEEKMDRLTSFPRIRSASLGMTRVTLKTPFKMITAVLTMAACIFALASTHADDTKFFEIKVVDEQTGRGVPMVNLLTVNNLRFVTDSAGRVALFEPGMMSREVFFYVYSHG